MAPIQRLGGTERVSHSRYIVNVVSAQEYLQYRVYRPQGASDVRPHPHLSGSWFLRCRYCLRLRLRPAL